MLAFRASSLVAVASVVTASGVLGMLYMAFFAPVSPYVSYKVVGMEADMTAVAPHLLATSEFCMRSENDADTVRILRRIPESSNLPEEVYEAPMTRIHFLEGCHTRTRRLDIPVGLQPGRYLYQASLRWCNALGNCESKWIAPVILRIDGTPGRHVIPFEQPDGNMLMDNPQPDMASGAMRRAIEEGQPHAKRPGR